MLHCHNPQVDEETRKKELESPQTRRPTESTEAAPRNPAPQKKRGSARPTKLEPQTARLPR